MKNKERYEQSGPLVQFCVRDFPQYDYARDSSLNPEMLLIVWQRGAYREIRTSPPDHRFGVDVETFNGK